MQHLPYVLVVVSYGDGSLTSNTGKRITSIRFATEGAGKSAMLWLNQSDTIKCRLYLDDPDKPNENSVPL